MIKTLEILRVENLKKYFPIRGELFSRTVAFIHAVDDVSFDIENGKTVGLVGESGCGKSTLGKCIVGLLEPTSGSILYRDRYTSEINRKELWQKVQMVFQDPRSSLNPRLTIGYSIGEPLMVRGIEKRKVKEKVTDLLPLVGLNSEHFDRYPHEFSGGQRQRLLIAKALITDPEFIVLDEPTSSLDVSVQAKILNLLNRLKNELNLTYLFVSHDLSVINFMCDIIIVMYLGKIVEMADKKSLFNNTAHPYTKLLLKSIPLPFSQKKDEIGLETIELPSNIDLPDGCRFFQRCSEASALCSQKEPELREIAEKHFVLCHKY